MPSTPVFSSFLPYPWAVDPGASFGPGRVARGGALRSTRHDTPGSALGVPARRPGRDRDRCELRPRRPLRAGALRRGRLGHPRRAPGRPAGEAGPRAGRRGAGGVRPGTTRRTGRAGRRRPHPLRARRRPDQQRGGEPRRAGGRRVDRRVPAGARSQPGGAVRPGAPGRPVDRGPARTGFGRQRGVDVGAGRSRSDPRRRVRRLQGWAGQPDPGAGRPVGSGTVSA